MALDPREFDALYNLVTELASAGRAAEARPYAEQFVATAQRRSTARTLRG